MPWDSYFRYYFPLWQTFLHLRLGTFDFFKVPASIYLLSAKLHATLPHCCERAVQNNPFCSNSFKILHAWPQDPLSTTFHEPEAYTEGGIRYLMHNDFLRLAVYFTKHQANI